MVVTLRGVRLGIAALEHFEPGWQDKELLFFLCWLFSFFGAVYAIRLPLNREDDGFFHDAIEESHGERAIGEIVPPFLKIHVRRECGGFSLVSQVDDFIK